MHEVDYGSLAAVNSQIHDSDYPDVGAKTPGARGLESANGYLDI